MSVDSFHPTQQYARKPERERREPHGWRRFVGLNALGVLLMVVAMGWSAFRVLSIHHEADAPGMKVIRIAHWQLEAGYRDAMQSVIDDYNRIQAERGNPVKVIQQGVTEKVYAQWLNVNLIADKAPDIAEMGMAKLANAGESVAKYFMPLGQHIGRPNPYNAPQYLDELENPDEALKRHLSTAPWRETLVDGMRGGYRNELQDWYSISTSFFTMRMFYNKPLLQEALGSDQPPRTLAQLLDTCEKLREWAKRNDRRFDPIAGTRYHRDMFVNTYRVPFTYRYLDATDSDLTGDISALESWAGFQTGKVSLRDPAMRAYFDVVRTICTLFNPQFAAMDRDQAIADFAQQRCAFMASGSWDAASVFGACKFEVGVMPFPLPAKGEPYGEYGTWGLNEAGASGSANFGITKTSKHPEIALDFLQFLSSHKWNQQLNRGAGWLPVAIGTTPSEKMKAFMPNPYGVSANIGFTDGFDLAIKMDGAIGLFLGGEIGYDKMLEKTDAAMADRVIGFDRIWFKSRERTQDNARALERTIAVQTSRLLFGTPKSDAEREATDRRVRETILDQTLQNGGENIRLLYERQVGKRFPEAP